MNCIVEAYMSGAGGESANSLRQISEQFSITLMKTRKILITAGVYHTELSEQVISLRENGKGIEWIFTRYGQHIIRNGRNMRYWHLVYCCY